MPWRLCGCCMCSYICEHMVRGRCTLSRNRKCHVGSRIFCCRAVILFSTVAVMDEEHSWAGLFFSDTPPQFVGELDGNPEFRHFSPDDEQSAKPVRT